MTAALAASWSTTMRYACQAADDFWCAVEERCPGLLPEREAGVFLAALGRLASGGDDPAGRAALLAVLGRAHRRYDLTPHQRIVALTLAATVARHAAPLPSELSAAWQRAGERALAAAAGRSGPAGDGPAWWPARVIAHDQAADGIAILTVRPVLRVLFQPGQAVPLCTERRPGRWRWYSPANAPCPDGVLEFHVRAVAAGSVSRTLVHAVRPGDQLWLGPPDGIELTVVPAFSHDMAARPGEWGDALTVALKHHRPDQEVYVCGPPAMIAGARLRLLAAGVPAERIHLPDGYAG